MGSLGGLAHPLDLLVGLALLGCSRMLRGTAAVVHHVKHDDHLVLIVYVFILIIIRKYFHA